MYSSPDPYRYQLEKVTITSDRAGQFYNVTSMVAEVEFFESLNNIHLYGYITIVDNGNIIENVDFQGTEQVRIQMTIPDASGSTTFDRSFYCVKVVRSVRGNDNVEAITLQLVDRDTFWNSTIEVSKVFRGKITHICETVVRDSFKGERKLMFGSTDIQLPVKYIAPGLTPYQILQFLSRKCTGPTGSPFFVFGSLEDRDIRFFDLKEMLELPNMNEQPYIYVQSQPIAENQDAQAKSYHISAMDVRNNDDMMAYLRNGDVGAMYNFYNTTGGYSDSYKFDIAEAFENLWNRSTQKTLAPVIDVVSTIGGEYITEKIATSSSHIATSGTFNDYSNIYEDLSENYHRGKSIGKALRNYIKKSSITITTPGRNFFPVAANHTVGNKIQIMVGSNSDIKAGMSGVDLIDQKKSGAYLILETKHNFRDNRYTTHHKLGKLGNQSGNTRFNNRIGYGAGKIDPALAKAAGITY